MDMLHIKLKEITKGRNIIANVLSIDPLPLGPRGKGQKLKI